MTWWRDGIIYQIYPRSFADSDGDGLGDLPGILSRLDYLQDLGVDAIWLSPIYPSPDADFGYDVADYTDIDPRYGTLADFDRLVSAAHERGIHVILDLVLNHTSDQHPWFKASRASRDNPYRDWYLWRDRPNNWQSIFGGKAWEYDPATRQYYYHMFLKQQPDLNWRNPQVRQAILGVCRFWLERGVDGFRLDVFNAYFKDAGFTNNPPRLGLRGFDRQRHIYDVDQPEMLPFLAEFRALLDAFPERYAVGETFLATVAKAAEYCGEDRLHAAFNFDFTNGAWNPARLLQAAQEWERLLGEQKWPNYVLNNHDLPRLATRALANRSDEALMVSAALLLTLRGTPFLYYGEEIGMRDISLAREQILDPVGRRYWPFNKGRDGCRAPMQWDRTQNAGFGAGQPWLPVGGDYRTRNAADQRADPRSLLNFYRKLIALRRETPALRCGAFELTGTPGGATAVYLRRVEEEIVLVALNFSNIAQTAPIPHDLQSLNWRLLLSNRRSLPPDLVPGQINLKPDEALIIAAKPPTEKPVGNWSG
jgi:alpha-glucosidase